jgi:hypothetical protein
MDTACKSSIRQLLVWLDERPGGQHEAPDGGSKSTHSSIWLDAWGDCLIQACAATPWIFVSAVGRLLFQRHA